MSDTTQVNMFDLGMDANSTVQLREAAKWARFLAIVGFVICALVALAAIFAGSFIAAYFSRLGGTMSGLGDSATAGMGIFVSVFYLGIVALYFFPCLFLYQFANKAKLALDGNDQEALNYSFTKLKAFFRYWGILTIIGLCFYGFAIVIMLVSLAAIH